MSDEKKYPWIKRIFTKKKEEPVKCVYAGPEMISPPAPPTVVSPPAPTYAGPEFMSPPAPVYAGPEQKGAWVRLDKVYEGPEQMNSGNGQSDTDADFNEVYAGPEFFEHDFDEPGPAVCVYAGPEYFNRRNAEPTDESPDTSVSQLFDLSKLGGSGNEEGKK